MQRADAIEIVWPDGTQNSLPYLWLRDNCSCGDCRVEQTSEKKFMLTSVSADIEPVDVRLVNDTLRMAWPDGHTTCYAGSELRAFAHDDSLDWTPWQAGYLPQRIDYRAFLDDDSIAAGAIREFLDCGAIILQHAPSDPGTLEEMAPRLGPVHEVLFDRIHNVEVDPSGYNVAHTALPLPPHTDFASYSWPPSVQALHMLVNEAPGGETVIVDGWNVLRVLRAARPDFFDLLCTTPVPFRMFDADNETATVAPMVRCDVHGNIAAFRFSNQLMQAVDPSRPKIARFYRAYHELCRRITEPSARVTFRLAGGEVLVVANHRVLHGRDAFHATGRRHLQDTYFELDNVRNHLVVLHRKGAI